MCGYIDYLFGLGVDYWMGVDAMNPGRLGMMIKNRFRLKAKTRNHISVDRFQELAEFIVNNILAPSPAGILPPSSRSAYYHQSVLEPHSHARLTPARKFSL